MKKTYIVGIVVLVIVFFVVGGFVGKTRPEVFPFVSTAQPPLLKTGMYSLTGYNSAEASNNATPNYIGTVIIDSVSDTYNLQWNMPNERVQKGVGILSGNVLSVSYVDVSGDAMDVGAVSYTLLDDNTLYGPWTSFFSRQSGREYLRWQKY